jgi:predicted nucleotidyltransferase
MRESVFQGNQNIAQMEKQQIKESLELLNNVLGNELLGMYLYGSSLVGGLQKYSDIDLFAVTNRATRSEEKSKLIDRLLQISGIYMKGAKRPIEMTLVQQGSINPWQYPPRCDFQYGEWLRESAEKGIIEPWENPDLAVIITQILLKSETLWGSRPEEVLVQVPYADFMKAMFHDVNRLAADLENDTRNVLLTLARIWSTLETDSIRSKPAAADWVMNHLPHPYQPVIKRAKSICVGIESEHWDDIKVLVKPTADFMIQKINVQMPRVNFNDPDKRIQLNK